MFRFNLKSVVCGFVVTGAMVALAGCSDSSSDTATTAQANTTTAQQPDETPSSVYFDGDHAFLECPGGASTRLLQKWLRVAHDQGTPDTCMPMDAAVKMVAEELPGLRQYIDEENRKVNEAGERMTRQVNAAMAKDPNVGAPELLELACTGLDNEFEHQYYQWTPFLDSSPAAIEKAVGQIRSIDGYGYDDSYYEQNDEVTYQQTIMKGPRVYGTDDIVYFPVYGRHDDPRIFVAVHDFYEAARTMSGNSDLPTSKDNFAPNKCSDR